MSRQTETPQEPAAAGADQQVHDPMELLNTFSRSKPIHGLLVAVLMHVLVIAATSVGYLRSKLAPETAAAPPPAASETSEQGDAAAAADSTPTAATPAPAAAVPAPAPAVAAPAAAAPTSTDPMETQKKAKIIQEITELPKEGEIPKEPEALDLSIEDTN
jgi:hypothetical protein